MDLIYIVGSALFFVVQIVFFLLLIEEFAGGHIHANLDFTVVTSLVNGFDQNIQRLNRSRRHDEKTPARKEFFHIPFSPLSIFGAKPPSSPTFVASRPYSALILDRLSFSRTCSKNVFHLQILQMMIHFRAHTHRFFECFCASGQEHKFLHCQFITSVTASIDHLTDTQISDAQGLQQHSTHIEGRHGKANGWIREFSNVLIQRCIGVCGTEEI